jgi:UDP-N-acetylmuramate--alanine ligase
MQDLEGVREVHVVGIGGAGMSAIARVLHGRGFTVHGSDRRESPITRALCAEGIPVALGHHADHLGEADLVLASSAVPDDNVELEAARARAIRVARRPEFLPALTAGYDVVAVAGAHGKTTVTGMLTLALLEAGLDPTYIVGGVVQNLGTNAAAGSGNVFVIEADEYRRTFLALRPRVAVVTNVAFDHPDCFPSLRFVRLAFGEFVDNIVEDGLLVACADDEVGHAVAASHHANGRRVLLYGLTPAAGVNWQASGLHLNDAGGLTFTVDYRGQSLGEVKLRVPGEFNVANALAVFGAAAELGVEWTVTRRALEAFEGTARRFEVLGEVGGVTVIDDYAHHPTQISGVLRAARDRYGDRRLVAVWEPHTFSRIRALRDEFMTAFVDADEVLVMPIYAAREEDDGTLTSRDLAQAVSHPAVRSTETLDETVATLVAMSRSGDVVLLMGAGNEYVVGRRFLDARV